MQPAVKKKTTQAKKADKSTSDESTTSPATENIEDEKKDTVTVWLIDEVIFSSSTKKYLYDDNYCFMGEEITNSDGTTNKTIHNDYKYDKNGNPLHMQYDVVVKYTEKYNEYSDITECIQIFEDYDFETDTSTEDTDIITYEYEYDENGNIVLIRANENYGDRENIYNVDFTYNKNGDLLTKTKRTVDGEITEGYCKYDNEGRLIHVSLFDHTFFNNYVTSYDYAYDNDGKMTKGIVVININYHSNHYISAENIIYDEDGNFSVNDSYATHKFDKNGNLIEKENYAKFTYTPIEVTPARKKAIERNKWDIYYRACQR